jgi:hypothetical protein
MPLDPCTACGAFTRAGTSCPHCGAPGASGASRSLAVAVLLGLSSCGLLKSDNTDYGAPATDTDWSDVDIDTDTDTDADTDTGESGGSGAT